MCVIGTTEVVPFPAYSLHFLNSSAPLVPPKPKEFDMAYSMEALRD